MRNTRDFFFPTFCVMSLEFQFHIIVYAWCAKQ